MIYLDNNATTFLDPSVLEEISLFFSKNVGNPSSVHYFGQKARAFLAHSTQVLARYFSSKPHEIVFTSGATEALNMLIRSVPSKRHIITSSLEHVAVLEPLKYTGCSITYLEPLKDRGNILPEQIEQALRPETAMIVLMAANNETGVKTDIQRIAHLAERNGITFIVDGVQILGKDFFTIPKGVSAICFSGHKIHAPSGIGMALIRERSKFHPLILGGPQQHHFRGGTENLAGIVGFSKAIELIDQNMESDSSRMRYLRDLLEENLSKNLADIVIHGKDENRVSNTSNIAFLGVEGETLLMRLDLEKIAVSHGSACNSGALEPSRVLLNMGISSTEARSSIRFSLSRFTTLGEIEQVIETVTHLVKDLRG